MFNMQRCLPSDNQTEFKIYSDCKFEKNHSRDSNINRLNIKQKNTTKNNILNKRQRDRNETNSLRRTRIHILNYHNLVEICKHPNEE